MGILIEEVLYRSLDCSIP